LISGPISREEAEREEVRVAQSHIAVGVDAKHQVRLYFIEKIIQSSHLLDSKVSLSLDKI
jgi:hypothetical protein